MTEKNSALVYDFGLNVEMALKLCEVYDKVYYYCEWRDAFPKADKALIGTGFEDEGLVRINEFWEYVDDVDAIYFFDTYTGDIAEYLKRKGYNVFGGGNAEMLENDRWFGRQLQKKVGLPTQRTVKIKGVSNLRQYLQDNDDVVVKINMFRGDLESFYSKNYEASKTILDYYASVLGLRQELVEFIVEDYLPGIEPGTDLYIVDGKYPNYGLFAYEMKGAGYAAKVMKYEDIPEQVRLVNDKLAIFFEKLKVRTLFSTEVRIDERDKKGYLIDATVRAGLPVPTSVEMEIYENFAEAIKEAAHGNLIDLKPRWQYGVGVALDSDWADEHWLNVQFPEELRQFIKFRRVMKYDNQFYAVPGFTSVCSVLGFGNTLDDAIEMCKTNIEQVQAFGLQKNFSGLIAIKEEIGKAKKEYDIDF